MLVFFFFLSGRVDTDAEAGAQPAQHVLSRPNQDLRSGDGEFERCGKLSLLPRTLSLAGIKSGIRGDSKTPGSEDQDHTAAR